jgi:hypothetical protein
MLLLRVTEVTSYYWVSKADELVRGRAIYAGEFQCLDLRKQTT